MSPTKNISFCLWRHAALIKANDYICYIAKESNMRCSQVLAEVLLFSSRDSPYFLNQNLFTIFLRPAITRNF